VASRYWVAVNQNRAKHQAILIKQRRVLHVTSIVGLISLGIVSKDRLRESLRRRAGAEPGRTPGSWRRLACPLPNRAPRSGRAGRF